MRKLLNVKIPSAFPNNNCRNKASSIKYRGSGEAIDELFYQSYKERNGCCDKLGNTPSSRSKLSLIAGYKRARLINIFSQWVSVYICPKKTSQYFRFI